MLFYLKYSFYCHLDCGAWHYMPVQLRTSRFPGSESRWESLHEGMAGREASACSGEARVEHTHFYCLIEIRPHDLTVRVTTTAHLSRCAHHKADFSISCDGHLFTGFGNGECGRPLSIFLALVFFVRKGCWFVLRTHVWRNSQPAALFMALFSSHKCQKVPQNWYRASFRAINGGYGTSTGGFCLFFFFFKGLDISWYVKICRARILLSVVIADL
jgi:hypothetical protein